MSLENLWKPSNNIRDWRYTEEDRPVYIYSLDLLIENTSKANITNFELKAEFFCSEEDFPNNPKEVHQWKNETINLYPGGKFEIGSIKVLSTWQDQFLWIRWRLKARDMYPIARIIDLRDERNNLRVERKFKDESAPPLPTTRRF